MWNALAPRGYPVTTFFPKELSVEARAAADAAEATAAALAESAANDPQPPAN